VKISDNLKKELEIVLRKMLIDLPEYGKIEIERQDGNTTFINVYEKNKIV